MGCRASKQGCCGENRPEELGKCAAVSPDVRWTWLRGRTLFTFYELRMLLKLFKAATYVSPQSGQPGESLAPFATMNEARPSELSAGVKPGSPLSTMDKTQFLSLCDSDETFRLSEVVGAFGSRLFDVLDEEGKGGLTFETFALGLSKLLKGPESEKLKLMYAAYNLSGGAPNEERRKSSGTSGGNRSGSGSWVGGGKPKASRRGKYLTLEDMSAVLASASEGAYPTLLQFTTEGASSDYLSGSRRGGGGGGESKELDEPAGAGEAKVSSRDRDGRAIGAAGGRGGEEARTSRHPEALADLLQELARRNAASYAAKAVSEFGQAQEGALTQKEFEKWALTGPVLRCRINEFSIDLDVAPFQGIRLE